MNINAIYSGDCKDVMHTHIPDESIDLIYVDPPFFSNKQYEVIWGDGYELRAFEDRWKGGIENYVAWMEDKISECHRILKSTGSMYLHCDWHANAHLRILMDNIFGANNFQNEIIWCYGGGGASVKRFARKHDNIFFYTKSKKYTFNPQFAPYKPHSPFHSKGEPYRKEGKVMEDYWIIEGLGSTSKENLSYPTQKPERLLERIINASSNPTDIVLDPMCGCGTAVVVAHKLGRRWIGIDVSPTACKLMVKRMRKNAVNILDKDIIGLPKTHEEIKAMQPFEFQNWVVQKLMGRVSKAKVGDFGIDGWTFDRNPIQVKQSEHIGRNVIDNFETALRRANKKKGIIVAFSFGSGAYEEVARAKNQDGFEIELLKVEDLIKTE